MKGIALRTVVFLFLAALAFLPSTTIAGEAPSKQDGLCELHIEGNSIVSLVLEGEKGSQTTCRKPGKVLYLPAGRYRVSQVVLKGDVKYDESPGKDAPWVVLGPDKPGTLKVGAPLAPTVRASREGSYLRMDYELLDAGGRRYRDGDRSAAPRFVVYEGDRQIGSGSFEYG